MKTKSLHIFITALLTLLISVICVPGQAHASGKAKISFDKVRHDFGHVQEKKGVVTCEFTFTNTGDANLLIVDATATCGCTRPEYPKQPIAPGKSGKIKVTYNPLGRPGPIDRTVTVKTNGKPAKIRLKIVGDVIP